MSYGGELGISPDVPDAGDVTANYLRLVSGMQSAAPGIYNTESIFQPKYTQLGLNNLNTILNGNGSTPGLIQQQTAATTAQRTANVGDYAALSPQAFSAYRGANPAGAALSQQLTQTASQGLDAGSALTPEQMRLVQQTTRAGQSARGLGWGPSDVFQESLAGTQFGNQLLQQRQGFAGNVAQMNAQDTNSALGLIGGQSGAVGAGQSFSGSTGPSLFSPAQQSDLFGTAYNADAARRIAGANNQASLLSY